VGVTVSNAEKRARWFDLGAAACARHAGVDDLYACPLCLDFYDRGALDGILTFEHAPPRCVGGKAVALTCSPCNSFASQELDPHIERSEEYLDFAFGTTRRPLRRTWQVDGVRVHGNIRATGDVVVFEGVAKANPPRDIETFKDLNVAEGAFTASASRGFDPQRAAIAWLRSAYVVSFATFGYRYIVRESLNVVRNAFADPENSSLYPPSLIDSNAAIGTRSIMVVSEPEWLRSVAVSIDRRTLFLPVAGSDPDFFDRIAGSFPRGGESSGVAMHGTAYRWPTRPMHAHDE
jgi:hypothetical protein